MKFIKSLLGGLFVIAIVYVIVSVMAYRFRNPHLTETELFLHIPEAVMWEGSCGHKH